MIAGIHHFGREDAGGAIQRGEGLVELSHVPADGWFALHKVDREASIRNFKRSLDASDAAANDQRSRVDRHMQGFKRFVVCHARNTA